MIMRAAFAALGQIFSKPFRPVMWRCLALTILLLVLTKMGLTSLIDWWLQQLTAANEHPWLASTLSLLVQALLWFGSFYLLPSISMLVSGFFVDEVAGRIETSDYADAPPGQAMSLTRSLRESLRFALVSLGINGLALMLFLLPGINVLVFYVANALLLGREYFALAAGRFKDSASVQTMRREHALSVTLCGFILAGFVMIPLLNLFTPLFATAMMVHVHKALERRQALNRPA